MITTLVRRVVPLFGLAVLLGSLIRTQEVPQASADAWFHLRFGREFLTEWSIRHPGHLGSYDSASWVPTQWLSQVVMALTVEHLGIGGLVFATGVVQVILILAVYVTCRGLASPLPAVVATAMCFIAISPGLSARPQLFSYLLIVMTTAAWLATARDRNPRYWVIALAWTWPMLHGMWPVGLSISVVAVLGLTLQQRPAARNLVRLAAIPVLSCLATVLNPVGFQVVRSILDVSSRSKYFAEWGPTVFTTPSAGVLALMMGLVVLAACRSSQVPWTHVALTLLALGWGLYSMRTTPVSALILAPLLASAIQRLTPDTSGMTRPEWISIIVMFVVSWLALLAVMIQRVPEPVVPAWVDARLDAMRGGTRVLNDWDTGSYFLFRHPDLDLVMHGYGDVFTDDEIARNWGLTRLEPGWDDLVSELEAEVALVDPDSSFGYGLEVQLGWIRIQGDDDFALLAPPDQP